MENQSVLANVLGQYKSLSLAAKTSVQNGVTGAGGAAALFPAGRELRQEPDPALVLGSVRGRKERKESAKRDPVLHGVHGVTGQAVQLHVGMVSETESGNVDHLQGENKIIFP